jgi:hypothetical protein
MEWILSGLVALTVAWTEVEESKNYQSYQECRVANPKPHNTVTSWEWDPCSTWLWSKHQMKK